MKTWTSRRHTILFSAALFSLIAFVLAILFDVFLKILPLEEDMYSRVVVLTSPGYFFFYLAAICSGIYSFVGSRREQKKMRQANAKASEISKLNTFVYASAVGIIVSSLILLSLLSAEASLMGRIPPRHIIVNHIAQIGKDASAFRVRSSSERSGRESFLGYQIPIKLTKPDGLFEYSILQLYDDSIVVVGKLLVFDTTFIMTARIEIDGRPRNTQILRDTPY